MKKIYVYPKLPAAIFTSPFIRFSGSGLANCLFVYARAIQYARLNQCSIIAPTWLNLSIGPYLRKEKDKRHYLKLFNTQGGEISGISKLLKLVFCSKKIQVVEGLGNFFSDLLCDSEYIASYIYDHVEPSLLHSVDVFDFTKCVAVHIRLGDYPENLRIPMSWYKSKIMELKRTNPSYKFLIFSDGRDDEIADLLKTEGVRRVFFGNAIADIFAISRCCYLIGSDSTFSGWGAYLGQVPCCFYRKHYGPVLLDQTKEIVESDENRWR